jgi:transcriptional regulator with XRE-family HTH domain
MSAGLPKRRQLGEAIALLRGEANLSKHHLADKTRTTVKIVESWEAGDSVPTTQEWQRMRAVFPRLSPAGSQYAEMYRAASAEQRAIEQAAMEVKVDEHDDLSAAVRLLLEAMPNLCSMTIEVDNAGEVSVAFKTREVRVVEGSGQLRVKTR